MLATFDAALVNCSFPDSSLCKQLAELLSQHSKDNQRAVQVYKDALAYDDTNVQVSSTCHDWCSSHSFVAFLYAHQIHLQLAKLELQNDNFDAAHTYCTNILKQDPQLEEPILVCSALQCE